MVLCSVPKRAVLIRIPERRLDCKSGRRAAENRVEVDLSVESQVTRKSLGAPAVPQEKWPPDGGRN